MSLYSTPDEAKSSHPDVKDAKHYERIYDLLQQSKQALLDSALEKDYNAKNSLTPTMLFVSILVHNGMHPDTAEAIAAMICKTLKLGTVENIQRCKAAIMVCVLPHGRESRDAFHNLMIALSISSEDVLWTDDEVSVDANGQNIRPPSPHTTRLRGLRLVANILRSVLEEVPADTPPYKDYAREDDSPLSIAWMLQRLIMHLVALASCASGRDPEDKQAQLHKFVEYCAMHCSQVFIKAELRTLNEIITYPDHRSPAQLNEEELDNANSGYRAALNGESIVPERHGVASNRNAPWHQLPATNGMRQQRERSSAIHARAMPLGGYSLTDAGKLWDDETRSTTRDVMKEMFQQYSPIDAEDIQDIDDLGCIVWKDPERPTRNYWGFSDEGLAAMRTNQKAEREKKTAVAMEYEDLDRPRATRTTEIERARDLATRGRGGSGGRGGRGRGGYRGGRGY